MPTTSRQTTLPLGVTVVALLTSVATIGLTGCDEKRPSTTPPPESTPEARSAETPKTDYSEVILPRVAKQIGDILGKPPSSITAEKNLFKDLGADSLDAVEIVMALEEEFDLTIDDASAEKMRTVEDIVSYIRSHKKP